jgi:hypothetical protein
MKRRGSQQRGFALIIVVLILAVLGFAGTIVLNTITIEQRMMGMARLSLDARTVADGALSEVVNDRDLEASLPDYASSNMTSATYSPSPSSPFVGGMTIDQPERDYDVTIQLVRTVPIFESSIQTIRAFVYDINVTSTINANQAADEATAQAFKLFAMQSGTVLPNMHAR